MGKFENTTPIDMEGMEQVRATTTKRVMEAMATIAEDKNEKTEDRIKAARTVDGMSDSLIKAYLMTTVADKMPDGSDLKDDIRKLRD